MNLAGVTAIDFFGGGGGVDLGMHLAGITSTTGVEIWEPAIQTARANGLTRYKCSVEVFEPEFLHPALYHHYSPPCQGFSLAGKGAGRLDGNRLLLALKRMGGGESPRELIREARMGAADPRSTLSIEAMRIIAEAQPDYITMEQVPTVMPLWQAIGEVLQTWGYHVWVGYVFCEQFGIAQVRKRAFLMARRTPIGPPVPTHSRFHTRTPNRLDPGLQKWVSMAEGLGWGMTHRPYFTVAAGTKSGGADPAMVGGTGARAGLNRERDEGRWTVRPEGYQPELVGFPRRADGIGDKVTIAGTDYRARDLRSTDFPSHTVTEKARSWTRFPWEDRFNDQSGSEYDEAWPLKRPATTVAGRGLIGNPGANGNRFNGQTKSRNDGIRVEQWEAGVLQGFPADYQWRGTRTEQFQVIGNAFPPLVMAQLVEHLFDE